MGVEEYKVLKTFLDKKEGDKITAPWHVAQGWLKAGFIEPVKKSANAPKKKVIEEPEVEK